MKVSEHLSKIRVRFKLWQPSRVRQSVMILLIMCTMLQSNSAQDDNDWDEDIAKPDDNAILTNNQGLKCDRNFISTGESSRNGTFTSATFENHDGHVRQCLYTFIAGPGERVHLAFQVLNLRGTPPDGSTVGRTPMCSHEYIDLYTEIPDSDTLDLIHSPFGGRYCGQIPPRRRTSLFRTIVLAFFTDKNSTDDQLFQGSYFFVKEDRYQIGTPVPRTTCSFTINGLLKRQGEILTPTYPGIYPKDLTCSYKFVGDKGQRIRLEFRDFDLFYGGPHCPFDFVNVYDGKDTESPLIGTYCGQQRNLVLHSTEQYLLVTFTSLKRTADSQNRGFTGFFEFSEGFVKLDFISRNDGEHVRGTECDQTILSRKGSSGVVYSPNYPFPYIPGIICRYFIYGLQDAQHFERVKIEFEKFDIPTTDYTCSDGFLKLYLRGQDINHLYDKYDADLCGNNATAVHWSEGPRLAMIFSSGQTQGSGFKCKYQFATEYLIPGTASPLGGCNFTYLSTSKKRGEFNSPRYPSRYPSNITCTYNFLAAPNEQTKLYFDQFKVRANGSINTYGFYCLEDWVEIYNVYPAGKELLLGRYCGNSTPGPIESNRGAIGLKVVLRTDEEGVYNGFKARYMFEKTSSLYGDCGANLTTPSAGSGVFTSPKYPEKYDRNSGPHSCHWHIHTRPGHRILLHFQTFNIEGDPIGRGCSAATVRIWKTAEEPPVEICGEKLNDGFEHYLSDGTSMKIAFMTADKVAGSKGFRAVWTEVKNGPGCSQFLCTNNSFCIAQHLRCDGIVKCGHNDDSDEAQCPGEVIEEPSLVLAFSLSACVLALVVTLCIICHRKRHRRRQLNAAARRRQPLVAPAFDCSRPSISLPSEIPAPPAPIASSSLFPSLPSLAIDTAHTV